MFENHDNNVKKPVRIIILGSGLAGVEVLKNFKKNFVITISVIINWRLKYYRGTTTIYTGLIQQLSSFYL